MDHVAFLFVIVVPALLGLAYVATRLPRSRRTTTWVRLAALTLRLIGLVLALSFYAVVGILFVVNRTGGLHSEEQLARCLWAGLLIGNLGGSIVHMSLLARASRRSKTLE